jgi:hypothetical protein
VEGGRFGGVDGRATKRVQVAADANADKTKINRHIPVKYNAAVKIW